MELKENGELYGVPKEVGEFTFTVIMEVDSDFSSSIPLLYILISSSRKEIL